MTTRSEAIPEGLDGERVGRGGLAFVLLCVLTYVVIHGGFRLLASQSLGEDDPLESLLVQDLKLGYLAPQPPLYDWVLWAVQKVTGTGILGFLVIKYGALLAAAGFIYATAVRVLRDRIWAMLAVESMALIYQIAWRYHEGFTHEVGAMAAVAATLWAFERVLSRGAWRDLAVFGLTAGLGVLTELTYSVFLASLLGAALLQPAIREKLLRPRMLVAVGIALVLASPWIFWIAQQVGPLNWVTRHTASAIGNVAKGILDAVRGPLFYLSPLIVILPLVFGNFLQTALADVRRGPNRSDQPDLQQLVLHQALAGVALCLAGAILLGASGYAMHRLMPLYLPSVIWLMGVCQRASVSPMPRRRFARLALLIAVIALCARLANMFVYDPVCKICRWGIPYAGLADELQRRGLRPGADAVVAVVEAELGGNLHALLGETRIIGVGGVRLNADARARQIAVVWSSGHPELTPQIEQLVTPLLPEGASLEKAERVSIPWHHLWRATGYRKTDWHVLISPLRSPDPTELRQRGVSPS